MLQQGIMLAETEDRQKGLAIVWFPSYGIFKRQYFEPESESFSARACGHIRDMRELFWG